MPVHLHDEAARNLRYIRDTMERAEGVSSVSGLGGMVMGGIGTGAAAVAAFQPTLRAQLTIWMLAAVPAVAAGAALSARKALARDRALLSDPARRFLLCLMPNLALGVLLTAVLWPGDQFALLPGVWMALYGAGVLAAGTYSVRPVAAMGVCFLVAAVPVTWWAGTYANLALGLTFGGLHLVFGWQVYRRHGG